MKKFIMIFSAIIVPIPLNAFPFQTELHMLIKRYLHSPQQVPVSNRDTQTYIDEHKKELLSYFAAHFNPFEPLPPVYCVNPAIFDIAKSHSNKDLFEQALSNLCFNPQNTLNTTNSNLFHVCCTAGTNKFLKRLLNYYKEHRINYRPLMNAKNSNGMTPLGLATQFSRTKCVSLLLSHGASPAAQPGSLMHYAASANKRGETKRNAVIQLLCDHDELLVTATNTHHIAAETIAHIYKFESTEQVIKEKKLSVLFEQLNQEKDLYLNYLPVDIFYATLTLAFASQPIASPASAQSLPVVSQ